MQHPVRFLAICTVFYGFILLITITLLGVVRQADLQVQRLAYLTGDNIADVMVAHADGSHRRILLADSSLQEPALWSPDGAWLATAVYINQGRNILRISANGTTKQQLTLRKNTRFEYSSPYWSPDGDALTSVFGFVFYNIQGNIIRQFGIQNINVMDGQEIPLTDVGDSASNPRWSPRGDWIVYVSRSDGLPSLISIRPDGSDRELLTSEDVAADFPEWSPDGTQIAYFVRNATGLDELRIIDAASGSEKVLHAFSGAVAPAPSVILWSPDGDQIAFHAYTDSGLQFLIINVDGGEPRVLVDENVESADWSPDGKWIAFNTVQGRTSQIYRIHPDGSDAEQLTFGVEGARFPQYAPIVNMNWSLTQLSILAMLMLCVGGFFLL